MTVLDYNHLSTAAALQTVLLGQTLPLTSFRLQNSEHVFIFTKECRSEKTEKHLKGKLRGLHATLQLAKYFLYKNIHLKAIFQISF